MLMEGRVRLNVEVPRDLWRRAKVRAAETDRELRELVIEALEQYLTAPRAKKGAK
jgi:hypothetical protein